MTRFTRIEGLSAIRRFPRLGKIGLGVKLISDKGCEYPKETDFFVLDPPGEDATPSDTKLYAKFVKVYGKTPKALNVVLPSENIEDFFPQALKLYGSNHRIRCTGNGRTALREKGLFPEREQEDKEDGALYEWPDCPCDFLEDGKCKQMGNLLVMLPDVSVAGYFQIDTSSFHSIVGLNSDIDYIRRIFGRVANLVSLRTGQTALILTREPKETHRGGKAAIHWPMRLRVRNADQLDMKTLQRIALAAPAQGLRLQLPGPETELIPGDQAVPTTVDVPEGVDPETGEVLDAAPAEPQPEAPAPKKGKTKAKPPEPAKEEPEPAVEAQEQISW